MGKHQSSAKSNFPVGKLAGTLLAAGGLLFAVPAATAFADPLSDAVNSVNNVVRGNVDGLNNIVRGQITALNQADRDQGSALNQAARDQASALNQAARDQASALNQAARDNLTDTNAFLRALLGL